MKIAYFLILVLQVGGIFTRDNYPGQENLERLCWKSGGYDAVAKLRNGLVEYQGCTKSVTTDIELTCSKIYNHCIKRLVNSAEACFRSDQHETIDDLMYKTAAARLYFACDHIDHIQKVISYKDFSCGSGQKSAFKNCVKRFISSRNRHYEADPVAALESLEGIYDAEGCSDLLGLERCTNEVLAECGDQSHSNFLEKSYQHINNQVPCDNLSKASTTAGVVGVLLLMSAAIHMYL